MGGQVADGRWAAHPPHGAPSPGAPQAVSWSPYQSSPVVHGLTLVFMVQGEHNKGRRMLGVAAQLETAAGAGSAPPARLAVYDRKGRLAVVGSTPHGLSPAPPSIAPPGTLCWACARRGTSWWLLFDAPKQQGVFSCVLQHWTQLNHAAGGSTGSPFQAFASPPNSPHTAGPLGATCSLNLDRQGSLSSPLVARSNSWSPTDKTLRRAPRAGAAAWQPIAIDGHRTLSGSVMHGGLSALSLAPGARPSPEREGRPAPSGWPSTWAEPGAFAGAAAHADRAAPAPERAGLDLTPQVSCPLLNLTNASSLSSPASVWTPTSGGAYEAALEELTASIERAGQLPIVSWPAAVAEEASVVLLKDDFGPAARARPQRMCSAANRTLEGDLFLEPSAMDMWAGM